MSDHGPERWSRRALLASAGLVAGGAALPETAAAAIVNPYIVVDPAGTGDFTSLEAAVVAAPAGATIFVAAGLHTIQNGQMNPREGVRITGSGHGSHIRAKNGLNTPIFLIRNRFVTLEHVRVDGNGEAQGAASLNCVMFNGADGRVANCYVHDSAGYNVVGFPGADRLVIVGNHVYSTVASISRVREGIELQGTSYCTVVGNTVRRIGSNGILLWNSIGDCGFNTVTGNTVENCADAGISMQDGAHDNVISGNAVNDTNWGIWLNAGGASGAPVSNTIIGNTVVGSNHSGVQLNGISDTVVEGNALRSNTLNGITLVDCNSCAVTGNSCTLNGDNGILVQDSSSNVLNGNVCRTNGRNAATNSNHRSGILLLKSTGVTADNVVSDNRCGGQHHGITLLNGVQSTRIGINAIRGNAAAGLWLSGASNNQPTDTGVVPFKRLTATVGTTQVALGHGLGFPPNNITITMTSPGQIWLSAAPSGTWIYMRADAAGRTANILVG